MWAWQEKGNICHHSTTQTETRPIKANKIKNKKKKENAHPSLFSATYRERNRENYLWCFVKHRGCDVSNLNI
jgi:hypothetical protein